MRVILSSQDMHHLIAVKASVYLYKRAWTSGSTVSVEHRHLCQPFSLSGVMEASCPNATYAGERAPIAGMPGAFVGTRREVSRRAPFLETSK